MKTPLLSIAIATKNREEFCIQSIQSILDIGDARLEITVADNSSSRKVYDFVHQLNSDQIKYSYTDRPISSIDNFNIAIGLTTGKFITLIGDDDTILHSMISAAEWMDKNDVDTLAPKRSQRYFWPGSRPQSPTGTLDLFRFSNSFEKVDAKEEIVKAAKNGLHNFYDYKVAKSYHGLVRRTLMEKVKEMTGNYYGALSPDVFSVMALSYLTKKHYFINYPLSVMGVCRDSTSAHQIFGEHVGPLEQMPHLKNRPPYDWDKRVPRYYCVSNTWAESGLHALEQIGAKDVLKHINIYPIAAMGILMNRKYVLKLSIDETEKMRKQLNIPYLYFWFRVACSGILMSFKKITSIVISKFQTEFVSKEDVKDISVAKQMCEDTYDRHFFDTKSV